MVEREAVIWAYRLLLGRDPENSTVIDDQMHQPDLATLRHNTMLSSEFVEANQAVLTQAFSKHRVKQLMDLMAEIDAAAHTGVVPPQELWPLVGGDHDYVEQGRWIFNFILQNKLIDKRSSVLDIGCGLGKQAIHFAEYLKPPGNYEGFDIEPLRIHWCEKAIAARYPHAHFRCLAIRNTAYNPNGKTDAGKCRFPYGPGRFDFVFLGSVFTHMLDHEVANYIGEIARVLKLGGRCLASFYLINAAARNGIAAGNSAFAFTIPHGRCWVETAAMPEASVAHEESRIFDMLSAAGLALSGSIRYGGWHKTRRHDQDFVIFEKPLEASVDFPERTPVVEQLGDAGDHAEAEVAGTALAMPRQPAP
jgi:SAM-dependent methyltransferase